MLGRLEGQEGLFQKKNNCFCDPSSLELLLVCVPGGLARPPTPDPRPANGPVTPSPLKNKERLVKCTEDCMVRVLKEGQWYQALKAHAEEKLWL